MAYDDNAVGSRLFKTTNEISTVNRRAVIRTYLLGVLSVLLYIQPYAMNAYASETNCRLVSSRGILKSCEIHSATPVSSSQKLINYRWEDLRPSSTVYVCTSAFSQFNLALEQIPCPIVLVSGDADEDAPKNIFASEGDFANFIESPKILHWFAQNAVVKHPKFSQIPIGLDYHTMSQGVTAWGPQITPLEQEELLIKISREALPLSQRLVKAHSNFHFLMSTKYGADRLRAKELIPASLVDYEPLRVDRKTTWENQAKYAFVVSPHGNGLDCHRTWEALCLGCIPIVRTSPIDGLFEGLPVYIVHDWNEVTEDNLKKVLADFSQRTFDLNRLTLSYWMNKINAKKALVV